MTPKKKTTAPAPAFEIGGEEQFRTADFTARIVGVVYDVYLPKSAASIALARSVKTDKKGNVKGDNAEVVASILEWVDQAFDADGAADIDRRLNDSRDKLDIQHLTEFMQKVVEHQTEETENPTT